MRRIRPIPNSRRVSPDEAADLPTFADWFATCLYDRERGYYASGNVSFGVGGDFSTFPERLSPLFGWMLVDVLEDLLEPLLERVDSTEPIVFLEFGGGNGDLARDVMERLDSPSAPWFGSRVVYRLVEPSAALRKRQRERLSPWIDAGRAEVVEGSITSYRCEGFVGFVFGNEVLDALPVRQFLIESDDVFETYLDVRRDGFQLSRENLAQALEGAVEVTELLVASDELRGAHLALVEEQRGRGLVPSEYYQSPAALEAIDTIASLLTGGTAAALLIDYGGTARQCLDPRTPHAHVRAYGAGAAPYDPYQRPGRVDLTWDVDFTDLGYRAESHGLSMWFGHQSAIESSSVDLWSNESRELLTARRRMEGYEPEVAEQVAEEWVFEFREGRGFRAAFFTPQWVEIDVERFGLPDPWRVGEVAAVADGAGDAARKLLNEMDLAEVAALVFDGTDIVGALSDASWYEARDSVVEALRAGGLLR